MVNAISVRLDDEALAALHQLESSGLTRSEAVRSSLVAAVEQLRSKQTLSDEVKALEQDENDAAEMKLVATLMDELGA